MKLPYLKASSRRNAPYQVRFGGYNHTSAATDGELYDMQNLTSDLLPIMTVRPKRALIHEVAKGNGIYGHEALCWVDGTDFIYDGTVKGTVTDSEKVICAMQSKIIIFPDKAYYDTATDTFGSLEATYQSTAGQITFANGTLYNQSAEGCDIKTTGAPFPFNVGDAVEISGCTKYPENNKHIIIREISADKKTLTFYEHSFTVGNETAAVTLKRIVPDMDFVFEHDNRLWGAKGDTIYCSKLGDPFNFNVFDGLSTDSYAVNVGSAGDFTGAISYMGYPVFFKEDRIYKVYGSKPSNFQVISSASIGVAKGSSKSLAIAGEALFYLSNNGVVLYSGGIPQIISSNFGPVRYKNGVGGSDGLKYYISMQDESGGHHLFAYDTQKKVWHKEDCTQASGFAKTDMLYMLAGNIYAVDGGADATEGPIEWFAEFADFTDSSPYKKMPAKVILRVDVDQGSYMDISIQYDSSGVWETLMTLKGDIKRSYNVPIIPKRCDHYKLKLSGTGSFKLYALAREVYEGVN